MWNAILTGVVLTTSGVFVGGLIMVAAAVVPAFRAVPCGTYVWMHQRLDHYIERYMPFTAGLTILTGLILSCQDLAPGTRALNLVGVGLTVTVSAISQFGNVPLNKRVKAWSPEAPPPFLEKTRLLLRWRRLHLARVAAGVPALLAFTVAALWR
nr:hypothetical protein [uncultured bacterium]